MAKESISFVAQKSKELVESPIQSYRSLFTKAGMLMGLQSLFLPLYIFIIERAFKFL